MNIEKIIAAIEQVDELSFNCLINPKTKRGCAIGQLFMAAGKSAQEVHAEWNEQPGYYCMFNGLLEKEYGIVGMDNCNSIWKVNDREAYDSPKARHIRVLTFLKGLLPECPISQSSSQVEVELNHSEGVLIAR